MQGNPIFNITNVRLPDWIFDKAKDNKQLEKELVMQYMQRYPDYTLIEIKGRFAVCEFPR